MRPLIVAHEDVLNVESPQDRKIGRPERTRAHHRNLWLFELSTLYGSGWLGWGQDLLRYTVRFLGLREAPRLA